jgi:hypothetical protein
MMKRSFFLALAAGLVASLMLTTPTQAGSVVTTEAGFSVTPSTGLASDIEVTYSITPTGPLTWLGTTTVNVLSTSIVGNTITVNFTPVNAGEVDFTFATAAAPPVTFTSASLTGVTAGAKGTLSVGVAAAATGVPEPASIALLGIGMTGFLAFRRFFKKTSVA